MEEQEIRATLALCLMAAFADGDKNDAERQHIREVADGLGQQAGALAGLYQDVLLGRVSLDGAAAVLTQQPHRQLAYEMAVGVCDADGVHTAAEGDFLKRLETALGLGGGDAEAVLAQADELAAAPVGGPTVAMPEAAEAPPAAPPGATAPAAADEAQLDRMILNAALLNGALELLPQSLASMAIIPLQTRLVYRIGERHGYTLDRGHITDFLATVGVGLGSQYLEQYGRKLVGGLLGKIAGKAGKAIGRQLTGSAFSFASTWALGQVARRYYGGGRTLSAADLKAAFSGLLGEARQLQQRYMPEIQEKARTLDVQQVLAEVRAGRRA